MCSELAIEDVVVAEGLPPECGDALRVSAVRQDGTLSLSVDSYEENVTLSIDWDMRFDLTCISALAEGPVPATQVPTF